jgi:hypothetical protein
MSRPEKAEGRKAGPFVQWFDVLFIMVLCFVTLMTTMLLRGKVLVGSGESSGLDYSFKPVAFFAVAIFGAIYLRYLLVHSDRELKDMIDHVYGKGGQCAEPGEPREKNEP